MRDLVLTVLRRFLQQNQYFSQISQFQLARQIHRVVEEIKANFAQATRHPVPPMAPRSELSPTSTNTLSVVKTSNNTIYRSSTQSWTCPSTLGHIFGAIQYCHRNSPGYSSRETQPDDKAIRVLTPLWLFGKVYEAQKLQDRWSCRFTFRSYNIFPDESAPLFQYAGDGNIDGLKQLFSSGQATPFDRIAGTGQTVLHVSLTLNY